MAAYPQKLLRCPKLPEWVEQIESREHQKAQLAVCSPLTPTLWGVAPAQVRAPAAATKSQGGPFHPTQNRQI
jgi:hypothetical protein